MRLYTLTMTDYAHKLRFVEPTLYARPPKASHATRHGAGFPTYRSVMSRDCKSRLSGPTMTVTSPGSMAGRREAS